MGIVRNVRRGERQPSFFTLHYVRNGQMLKQTVLSFRLELSSEVGDVAGYRQVEMVGDMVRGDIVDGDAVEISSWEERDGLVIAGAAFNHSSGSLVTTEKQEGARLLAVVGIVLGTISTIVFFVIVAAVLSSR